MDCCESELLSACALWGMLVGYNCHNWIRTSASLLVCRRAVTGELGAGLFHGVERGRVPAETGRPNLETRPRSIALPEARALESINGMTQYPSYD